MPQRFLRPGITTSERFNKLEWQEQSFYLRLITLVDDYGRFEANPMLLKSLAFPFNPEITCEQMLSMCDHLQANDMAIFYTVDGKKYLQLTRWQERARSASKFPPHSDNTCEQMFSTDSKCSAPSPSSSPAPASSGGANVAPLSASLGGDGKGNREMWQLLKDQTALKAALKNEKESTNPDVKARASIKAALVKVKEEIANYKS